MSGDVTPASAAEVLQCPSWCAQPHPADLWDSVEHDGRRSVAHARALRGLAAVGEVQLDRRSFDDETSTPTRLRWFDVDGDLVAEVPLQEDAARRLARMFAVTGAW